MKEEIYTYGGFIPGEYAIFSDSTNANRWVIAKYLHTMVRTPFHVHFTEGGEYFETIIPLRSLPWVVGKVSVHRGGHDEFLPLEAGA
jgi:hypothetical protein